ncbi:NADP-dependent oxidoreductase [Leekyejoonella antrihumi]|nr:NADP-dependent oxidoreductase [Leekyejoonella antrihumi]
MTAFVVPEAQANTVEPARVPVPQIGADELLVRIKAVGVGIHDSYFLPSDAAYPFPAGIEAAGVVEAVGSQVEGRHLGERIAFVSSMQVKGGTWAEYAAVRADSMILPIPDGLDFVQAAAIPVAGSTALRAMCTLPPIPAGGSIFVAGASGAIGTFAIQLARLRGWRVAASASRRNHDYLAALGATMIVDYHEASWPDRIRSWAPDGVDAALAVPPHTSTDSLTVVKNGGTVVTISGDKPTTERGVKVILPSFGVDVSEGMRELFDQVGRGEIRLEIEHVYPFDQAPMALAKVQTRHARGKLVLSLTGD